jgi:hypothetical protein
LILLHLLPFIPMRACPCTPEREKDLGWREECNSTLKLVNRWIFHSVGFVEHQAVWVQHHVKVVLWQCAELHNIQGIPDTTLRIINRVSWPRFVELPTPYCSIIGYYLKPDYYYCSQESSDTFSPVTSWV